MAWFALPTAILFEWFSPAVLVFGYVFTAVCYATGLWSAAEAAAFLTAEIGMGMLMSASALLMDEMTFHVYPKFSQVAILFLAAIAENFGFRQVTSYWRLVGLWRSVIGAKVSWGSITRTAAWQSPKA